MPVEEKDNRDKGVGSAKFAFIEAAWLAQTAHRQLYSCSKARVIPVGDRTFCVHCRLHGRLQQGGQPVEVEAI
ncbi:MAG: hypothetical protein V3S39_07775 [Thermodesulfobacteriota bacterium]